MTVWYFDAEERAEAKKKFRNLTGMTLKNVHLKYQIALNFFFFISPRRQRQTGNNSVARWVWHSFFRKLFHL